MYTIALFGFRILDPLPAARRAAIEQMYAGVVVFDAAWRVLSLNPFAEKMLGARQSAARGKTWQQLAAPGEHFPALVDSMRSPATAQLQLPEMTFGTGAGERYYAPALSELRDFRGLLMGYLLTLSDVTEARRAQTQVLEQQRSLVMVKERELLARELHDGICQVLGYVAVQARAARDQVDCDHKEVAHEYLTQLITAATEAHSDVRDYILGAGLTSDPNFDLFLALEQHLRRFATIYGVRTELTIPPELGSDAFDMVVKVQLLRIIQEALTNARKHASARLVQVQFECSGDSVRVIICDNGAGFDPQPDASDDGHFGLRIMRERAQEIGGVLKILSDPGRGTQVVVEAPLRREFQMQRRGEQETSRALNAVLGH